MQRPDGETVQLPPACVHGSMLCPDCDGADDDIQVVGRVIHGVECYEAWRDLTYCPHEQDDEAAES